MSDIRPLPYTLTPLSLSFCNRVHKVCVLYTKVFGKNITETPSDFGLLVTRFRVTVTETNFYTGSVKNTVVVLLITLCYTFHKNHFLLYDRSEYMWWLCLQGCYTIRPMWRTSVLSICVLIIRQGTDSEIGFPPCFKWRSVSSHEDFTLSPFVESKLDPTNTTRLC